MDLSVIIPVFNEADNIARLLNHLHAQQRIGLEIILVDGGSTDETETIVRSHAANQTPVIWLSSPPGRAKQMNTGAKRASASTLLFLHADTAIKDAQLLANGLAYFNEKCLTTENIAAHFGLRFERSEYSEGKAWFFYEAKTHLNRRDCINGDQGFMMRSRFFEQLGGFDESLGYLEDLRLARKVTEMYDWITLPGIVESSARRFEVEGLPQRQALNSFIKCLDEIGFHEFFEEAGTAYQLQSATNRLMMSPYAKLAIRLSSRAGIRYFYQSWYRTGRYVARNAWQLAFLLDCRACRGTPADVTPRYLTKYDKWLAPVFNSPPIGLVTGIFTFLWVCWMKAFGPQPKTATQ